MKKLFTLLFLIFAIYSFGQTPPPVLLDENDNVVSNTIIDVNIAANGTHDEELFVYNPSSSTKTCKVTRTVYVKDASDQTQFCWGGLCYGFNVDQSGLDLDINASDTVNFAEGGFHHVFNAGAATIVRAVHYQFYDINGFNDTVGVTFRYNFGLGIAAEQQLTRTAGTLSNAYPSPASSFVTFKYDMNESSKKGEIILYDVLGKAVKNIVLNDKKGTAKINVDDLNEGIYFYTFTIDGKAITTRRLVVNSK